jgi:hypothetical protein
VHWSSITRRGPGTFPPCPGARKLRPPRSPKYPATQGPEIPSHPGALKYQPP